MPKELLLFILLSLGPVVGHAMKLDPREGQRFAEAAELYVLANEENLAEIPLHDGTFMTVVSVAEEMWPEKRVVVIPATEYDQLEELNKRFFLSIARYSFERNNIPVASAWILMIQRGKSQFSSQRLAHYGYLNWFEIKAGRTPERLVHTMLDLREGLLHPKSGERKNGSYKMEDMERVLATHTLLIDRDDLSSTFDTTTIGGYYPYRYELVETEEWSEAVRTKRANTLYLERVPEWGLTSISIFNAETGALVQNSYPWPGPSGGPYELDKRFFRKMFR